MKKRPMFFVLLLSFLFISCENLLSPKDSYNNGDGKTYTITGDINIEGALPNELFNENSTNSVARTGFPTVPNISDTELNLYVFATNADSSFTIEGTINAEKTQYSINLPKGQWTITVSGKKSDVVILEGSVTVELNDEYVVSNSETIILKPVKTTGGKGNLSLKLALNIGSFNCGGVKATLSSSEDPKTKYILFTDSEGNPTSEIDLEFSDISSGTYSFDLVFYDRMNFDDAASDYVCENIIYILNDTVNIFDGLTTNEWSGTGYSEDKTTFSLTQEMITNFAMTTFYVDADYGNDDNEGTFFAPFKSIQSALDKIEVMNVSIRSSESTPYRILLKSDVACENSSDLEASGSEKGFVMIEPGKKDESGSFIPLYLEMASYDSEAKIIDANRDENKTGRVIDIGVFANVTLKNLKITGGYTERSSGGGIFCTGNLTLDNCEIYGNESYLHGGGLSLITGIRVTGITCRLVNSKIHNNTSKNGNAGGVYIKGGNLIMEDGSSIIENTSNAGFGGGIYSSIYEHEGTVYNGTVTINGGEVSENSAMYDGGGVYIDSGDFTITGGKISENTSSIDGEGGGVYVNDGTFTIENDALISKNTSCGNGGGVFAEGGNITINGGSISENIFSNDGYGGGGIYLTGTAHLTMTGGKISNNYPKDYYLSNNTFGGGVYVSGGTFTMEGGEISNNYGFYGGGVATDGSFSMSGGTISGNIVTNSSDGSKGNGSAVAVLGGLFTVSESITINGDVYLFDDQTITVSNNFVGGEVMITPSNYESSDGVGVGVQVLKPIGGTSLTTEIVRKFEVTPQVLNSGGYEYWYVKSDGMLAKDSIIYVNSDSLEDGDGTLDKPFITIQEAVNKAINDSTAGSTKFKILLQSDVEDISTDSYTNDDNFSLINIAPSDDKQNLTLEIASYGENSCTINANKSGEKSGRVMYIGQKANVTLRNVNIKGGNLANGNGGAIYCSGTLNLVNSTISESNAKNGGGIYIENGTFTMNGGIIGNEILEDDDTKYSWEYAATTTGGSYYSNFASSAGGGIYAENATVNIISGKVSYNYAINYESAGTNLGMGGGIFMKNGTLTIGEGAEVSYNSGYQGAGIRCESETLGEGICTIKEGAIIKGNATHIYNQTNYGGGIFVKNSNFIMEGGTIEENYAGDGGAGIHLENVSPTITKGNIRNNKYGTEADAHKFGSEILLYDNAKLSISSSNVVIESLEDETRGIYVRNLGSQSELALSDSAYIKSPVYLDANANIKITGALTTPEEANGIIATITPNEYNTNRQVLVAGSGVIFSDKIVNRFLVTQENGNEWYVTVNGNLQKIEKDGDGYYLGREPSYKDITTETVTTENGDVVLTKVSCSIESYDNMLWIAHGLKDNTIHKFDITLANDIEIPSGKWQFYQLNVADASTIDGQEHSITINEDVSSFGNDAGGLFYKFNNSTVKNLVLKGSITANTVDGGYIGALCRSAYGSIFENVMSEVTIINKGSGFAGGLIGILGTNVQYDATKAMVNNCAVYADVSSTNGIAGGILGAIWDATRCCTIQNSVYMGEIKGTTVGAIAGKNGNNEVAKSVLKNIWYCVTNDSEILLIGTKADTTEEDITDVESKTPADIATEAAATLLNTNSDGTVNDVWEYVPGSDYPTLKTLSSE